MGRRRKTKKDEEIIFLLSFYFILPSCFYPPRFYFLFSIFTFFFPSFLSSFFHFLSSFLYLIYTELSTFDYLVFEIIDFIRILCYVNKQKCFFIQIEQSSLLLTWAAKDTEGIKKEEEYLLNNLAIIINS